MVARIRNVLLLLVLVGAAIGVVVQNLTSVSFRLYPGSEVELYSGLLVLVAFTLGALVSFVGLLVFGVRSYFRERALESRSKRLLGFIGDYVSVREASYLESQKKGDASWRKLAKTDPSKLLCRLELAKRLLAEEDATSALRELELIRLEHPKNAEVLALAARTNEQLGNRTAALDNLALILSEQESPRIARQARDLSFALGRFEDAIEYHDRLRQTKLESIEELKDELAEILTAKALAEHESADQRIAELKIITRKYPNSRSTKEALAEAYSQSGQEQQAAEVLSQLAKSHGLAEPALRAAEILVRVDQGDKALSVLKSVSRAAENPLEKARLTLGTSSLLLTLGRGDEVVTVLDDFDQQSLQSVDEAEARSIYERMMLIRGYCFVTQGKGQEAVSLWRDAAESISGTQNTPGQGLRLIAQQQNGTGDSESAPAPRLSTP